MKLRIDKFIVSIGCYARLTMQIDKSKLKTGTRVTLDMTTFTIMRALPREVDPSVYEMLHEDPGDVSFSSVGGLNEQIRELREVIELPLTNPELFKRVGIKPPKVRTSAGDPTCVGVPETSCLYVAVEHWSAQSHGNTKNTVTGRCLWTARCGLIDTTTLLVR